MAQLLSGPAAEFLRLRRTELNRRFARARRRFPALDGEAFLRLVEEVLPPLAGPEPAAPALLEATYDLLLLHAGRGALGARPGLGVLLRECLPGLRPLLLARPGTLVGALSNAVENLGERGEELARRLGRIGAHVASPEALLDLGALLAWRLGEARLRSQALAIAATLPPRVVLAALDLEGWPEAAAPLGVAALRGDAWQAVPTRVSQATLRAVDGAPEPVIAPLAKKLESPAPVPLAAWRAAGWAGEFRGFGGAFEVPPRLLDGGDRHRFHVAAGAERYVVDADVFGWVCSPAGPDRERAGAPGERRVPGADVPVLGRGGSLERPGERVRFPELAQASSHRAYASALAWTHPDSHRIRVLAPRREAL